MSEQPLVLAGQYGSPYTLKMRGVLRYRHIPFRWVLQNSKWWDLPAPPVAIIPVIAYPNPDGSGYRDVTVDSSPQIMRLEGEYAGRSLVPSDPALAFVDMLIEDFADEWLTKAMYHYRWAFPADIDRAGKVLPVTGNLQASAGRAQRAYDFFTQRQIGRRALVGSTEQNAPLIEASYRRVLAAMQDGFTTSDFVLGDRPGRGDFGLYGQLSQLVMRDPTSAAVAVDVAPKVIPWVECMDDLSWLPVDGDAGWYPLEELPRATRELLVEAGHTYAPFMIANAHALATGADEVVCRIAGPDGTTGEYRQGSFTYQGKCLQWLREAYRALGDGDRSRVDAVLAGTGCETLFE